jgi:hypothetical protein
MTDVILSFDSEHYPPGFTGRALIAQARGLTWTAAKAQKAGEGGRVA